MSDQCKWCGLIHLSAGKCPSVRAFEYHPDGTIKRVEFMTPGDYYPAQTVPPQLQPPYKIT